MAFMINERMGAKVDNAIFDMSDVLIRKIGIFWMFFSIISSDSIASFISFIEFEFDVLLSIC